MRFRSALLLTLSLTLSLGSLACDAPLDPRLGSDQGAVEHIDGWADEPLDIYFSPGSAVEDRIAEELEGATESIRVAMYNLRSDRLGWLLLDRQNAGIDVQVLWDAKQMAKDYNTLDDELIAAGLNVVPIQNDNSAYATLHDKLAVIDGHTVFLGSANWGPSALYDNNETTLAVESPALAQVVDAELDELVAGEKQPRSGSDDDRVQLYFSPEDRLDQVTIAALDAATERIEVAVFSLYYQPLTDALIRAKQRGVEVYVVTDAKQSAGSQLDEQLRDAGIPVIEALNQTSEYTAMHHKFAVIDGATTLVGSYNWSYTATFKSYEDLAVIAGDPEVAAAFEGEVGRLWQRYGTSVGGPKLAPVPVDIAAWCDGTAYGDTLVLVGDRPELGGWDPHQGIFLDGRDWPTWRGQVSLPAGTRIEYKLVILRADGRVDWERGDNRVAVVPTDVDENLVLGDGYRY